MPHVSDETYEFFTPGFECGFERGIKAAQRELEAMRKWVEALREQLKEVFAELTDVQQENIFDGIPPSVAITHHFRRVQQSLKLKLEDFLPAVGAATESGEGAPDHV